MNDMTMAAKRSSDDIEENLIVSHNGVLVQLPSPPRRVSSRLRKNRQRVVFSEQVPESSPLRVPQTVMFLDAHNEVLSEMVYGSSNSNSVFGSFMSDDVFCHMMSFVVVSETGQVDGDTVKSMSPVCKHWHKLVNTPSIWALPSGKDDDDTMMDQSATMSSRSHVPYWRDVSTTDFSRTLIGFRKVGSQLPSFFSDDSVVYRIVDRGNSCTYVLRTVQQDHQQEQRAMFQHIANTHQIVGDDGLFRLNEQGASNIEIKESLLFPLNIELCHESSKMLVWYDNCEESLSAWLEGTGNGVSLEQVKGWVRDLFTAFSVLEANCVAVRDLSQSTHSRNLFLDRNSSRLRLLVPEFRIESTLSESRVREENVQAIAAICARISVAWRSKQHDGSTESIREASEISNFAYFLLQQRPTLRTAMSHSYLVPIAMPPKASNLVRSRVSMERPIQMDRRHVKADEWATLVDWQLEICRVLGENTCIVFRAMNYFDTVIRKTVVSPRHYQLFAGTCLYVASKSFGDRFISARDVAFCADNSFGQEEVKATEQIILAELEWRLAPQTMLGFARAYVVLAKLQHLSRGVDVYSVVSHLALETQLYRLYSPSVCGAAAVVVAFYMANHRPVWPDILQQETGLTREDLQAPVSALCADVHHIRQTAPNLTMLALFPVPSTIDLQSLS